MPFQRTAALALAGLAALASVGLATIVLHADVAKLASHADVVVDGTVSAVATHLDTESGGIWTVARVDVKETLSGEERRTVDVSIPGGRVGELTQEVSGTAHLEKGDRAVLFLAEEAGRLLVLGQAQGCFRVTRDKETKALVCRNRVHGLALVTDEGERVAAEPIQLTLADLKQKIAAVVREREEAERRRREKEERKLDELRKAARRNAERMRGKPGGGE